MPSASGQTAVITDVSLAAATSGKRVRVYALHMYTASAVEARIFDGPSASGTELVGPTVNGLLSWTAPAGKYLFQTSVGAALVLDLQTAVETAYSVQYDYV